ncbi:hypothetical protein F4775DRAFT_607977 [Biscogniauxia sp. FL1348]|nr:hypothetical protein F4775DRAFT_607977 [Biscogniauxia sp. FL1348]
MSRVLTIKKIDGKPGQVYYPLELTTHPKPVPGPGEVLVRMRAAALNHRDLFIRQHLYPGISFAQPLLADGCGTVVALGSGAAPSLLGQRVLLTPCRGWESSVLGPEDAGGARFAAVGGAAGPHPPGTGAAQDYAAVPARELEPCPPHLTDAEAAALPLAGLTAWRALVTKTRGLGDDDGGDPAAPLGPGAHVLITGIGGGVALAALQFAVARGCAAWVTSSRPEKLARARDELGARGGVLYTEEGWDRALAAQLPASRPYFDAILDGAGGDVMGRAVRLLRGGGAVVCYGMTAGPRMDWGMAAVLRNLELRGSTMGSRAEFRAMVDFVRRRRLRPVVARAVPGLDDLPALDGLFDDMRRGSQFGKLVVIISSGDDDDEVHQKLDALADAKL